MNLARRLSLVAGARPEKTAVRFEDTVYTYGDLDSEIARHASMLHGFGVSPGDRVGIQLPKCMEFVFLELAVLSVGGIVLPLNSDYKQEEVHYFLADSGSRFLFTDAQRFDRFRGLAQQLPELVTVVMGDREQEETSSLTALLAGADEAYTRTYPTGDDDVAMIIYTSGTTGRSKGALLSHANLVANMDALHVTWEWSDRDVLLHALPLFHVHGLFVALHGALNAGARVVMHEKFDPARIWDTIGKGECTILMGVPTMYQRLVNQWEAMERTPSLASMRLFISGSAPLLESQFNRFEKETGSRILERYGMTEAGMIASNPIDSAGRIAGSVGFPLPGVSIRVVDPDGADKPPGEVGEVWIRGDNVFQGYWGMPEKTAESFHEGWFKTGDLGYLDAQERGRLFLVGRAKELIITGGYNVYPKEIEDVLESHGSVTEAAVVGLPDEDFGERVIAVVCLGGREAASAEQLIGYCRERLAGYKCPKQVFVVDALPRNAMGKLQKNVLVKQFAGK
ncbi:MAG: AMP-binding protein [Thermodesulfobacteriota bacterium]